MLKRVCVDSEAVLSPVSIVAKLPGKNALKQPLTPILAPQTLLLRKPRSGQRASFDSVKFSLSLSMTRDGLTTQALPVRQLLFVATEWMLPVLLLGLSTPAARSQIFSSGRKPEGINALVRPLPRNRAFATVG